jgi:hypothetical protein
MNLVGIVRQEGKPNVVVFRYRSSEAAAIDITDHEVLEIKALPTRLNRHLNPP